MDYSKKAIKHFKDPKFAGEMKNPNAIGEVGNPSCGDTMKIYLKVGEEVIKDIKFQTYGCIAAIASSNALCKLAKGKKIERALKLTHKDILKELDDLPPVKVHCSVLGRKALQKAIENYKKNNHKIFKEKIFSRD